MYQAQPCHVQQDGDTGKGLSYSPVSPDGHSCCGMGSGSPLSAPSLPAVPQEKPGVCQLLSRALLWASPWVEKPVSTSLGEEMDRKCSAWGVSTRP